MTATALLAVPNPNPHRPAPERIGSIDDVNKLALELDKAHLNVEPTCFASGNFSDVFAGTYTPPQSDGIDVAVKVLRIPGQANDSAELVERLGKHVGREVFVWQMVKHPRITPFIGYIRIYKDGIIPCIVTKRRQQGNLKAYLGKNPQADRFKLALEGLIYLHTFAGKSIIHFDIKPENILINDDGEAELCDFGYAKVLGGEPTGFTTSPNPGGTYPYMSPEVLNGSEWELLTPAADVFAMGSTILFVLSGKLAWYYVRSKAGLLGAVSNGIPAARDQYVLDGSPEAVDRLWELLERCWRLEPNNRPSSQEVLDELRAIEALGGVRPPSQTP
ncbi:hypothetical protein M407DRAFT_22459 [Tulasnella calospora MUT 4182]|uniref:Protein kinase domain-containing protein n=1 Tax=Tulasnella calospora MUT 4182 TaxID=1051891 RepID=A0A0C3M434_9AGAM|nr:hypothetical protein M407DRAFT_22459 [Tulasnella calospora MUT 4182]